MSRLFAAALVSVAVAFGQNYSVTILPGLGGSETGVRAINDAGCITGYSALTGDANHHAFLWTPSGGMVDLGTLGGPNSEGWRVNSSCEQVAGSASTASGSYHAFLWTQAGGMIDLGTLGGSSSGVTGFNDAGQVVGSSTLPGDAVAHAFMWTAATGMVDLGTLNGNSSAHALNASGQVAGVSQKSTAGNGLFHPFFWSASSGMIDLGTLGGTISSVWAMNSSGQVIGGSHLAGNVEDHAFRWTPGSGMVDLGTLGGTWSHADGITATGRVAGSSWIAGNQYFHPFSWTQAGGMVDLGTLGGNDGQALGINSSGQIIGKAQLATSSQYHYHAALWTDADGVIDLNTRVLGAPPGFEMDEAFLISDSGWIACYSNMGTVLLIPVSNTPAGTNVTVTPETTLPDGSSIDASIEFGSVLTAGTTTISTSSTPDAGVPSAPPQFKMNDPAVYYDVQTTAVFSGPVMLCFMWVEGQVANEVSARLFHYENGAWQDVTFGGPDTVNNKICGSVTSLSPFAIFEPGFQFSGFKAPVAGPPTVNLTKAGSTVPVKFSLGGDKGLNIFRAGSPTSVAVNCDSSNVVSLPEPTETPGNSSLSYAAGSDTYTYQWKTEKSWSGCRQLVLHFTDGGIYRANFKFE